MTSITYVIAEAGVNHNGNEDLAKKMIDAAKAAGADAVKFQLFDAAKLTTRTALQAQYQVKNTAQLQSQYDMLKALELSCDAFARLFSHAQNVQIDFIITPFDLDSLHYLIQMDLPVIKIGSGDLTHGPLLLAAARSLKKLIISTGMSDLSDIELAMKVLAFGLTRPIGNPTQAELDNAYESDQAQSLLRENVTLLHCTSEYPTPFNQVNLKAMDTLQSAFGVKVGLSDHTPGLDVAIAAVARNAVIIEKHFTLDKNMPGPDHLASLDIPELTSMIQAIRHIEMALGTGRKYPLMSEKKNISVARRGLVASQAIRKGEVFSSENMTVKRPAQGLSPMHFWRMLGQTADKDFEMDEAIS